MATIADIRSEIRLLVDPMFIRFRSELMGSGVSYGRIQPQALPTTVIYNTTAGDTDIGNMGYIKGIKTYSGGTLKGSTQTELSFNGMNITVAGSRTTISALMSPLDYYSRAEINTIVSGLFNDPTTTLGDTLYRNSTQITRLPIGISGQVLTSTGTVPMWKTPDASGITTSGNILFVPSGTLYTEQTISSHVYGPIFQLTTPVTTGWTWVNQGSATLDTTYSDHIYIDNLVNTQTIAMRKKAAPSTPYTIDIAILVNAIFSSEAFCGLCWRQSSDGKLVTHAIWHNSNVIQYYLSKWNSPTSFNSHYTSQANPTAMLTGSLIWLRMVDDGVNRLVYFSVDGQHWAFIYSVDRADFLTADEVGFFAASNGTSGIGMSLLHWKES